MRRRMMPPLPNQRQERFVRALVQGKSTSEAYEFAGYRPNRGNATRLKTNEVVQRRISELQQRAARRSEITLNSILEDIEEDRALARELGQTATAMQGNALKAKLKGYMVDRKEVGGPGAFEAMDAEQLTAALVKI